MMRATAKRNYDDIEMDGQFWLPQVDINLCTGCGDCIRACPTGALSTRNGKAFVAVPEVCTYSGACEAVCPWVAIALPYQIVSGTDFLSSAELHSATSYSLREVTVSTLDSEKNLDVREIAPARRHPLIFGAFEELTPGQAFVLVNDHDPKPLYYQFQAERAGQFTWDYLEQGPEVWRVRIGKAV